MKNDSIIYIFGHKNPDTDSICSAIAYSELKKIQGYNAYPVRLGKINKETRYVLDYFNIPEPDYLPTVRTQISDCNIDVITHINPELSLKKAWDIIKETKIKVAPVVDEKEKLLGVVTISDITSRFMGTIKSNIKALKITPLKNILETLDATLLCGSEDYFNTTGKVNVAAMTPDGMEPFVEKGDIVLVGNRKDSQVKAIEVGANCIIVTCEGCIDNEVIELARIHKCILMRTRYDTYTAALLINQSIPVGYVMTKKDLVTFQIYDYVDDIKEKMTQSRYRAYPVVDNNNRIKGFITRYHLISRKSKKVILVDHNEKSQSIDGLKQAQILEIIDHHRIGGIETGNPVLFKNEPVGSTATIIAGLYFENNIEPAADIAGILCAAIISDTIYFKSPTCTQKDKQMFARLSRIANIDTDAFAMQMLNSSSSLAGLSPDEILNHDFKEYTISNNKVGIGQINSFDLKTLNKIRNDIIVYLDSFMYAREYSILMIMFTDITRHGSEIIYVERDKGTVDKAFEIESINNSMFLEGIVSRKKQIVPFISNVLQN